jgi:flagellar hook-associated protein 3 FlgL
MRISTPFIQMREIETIVTQQRNLMETQNQLATGKRILVPSDDPVATSESLSVKQAIATVNQYQDNATAATNRLSLEESIMGQVTEVMQRVRELTVQGMNATQTNESRKAIAVEVRQRMEDLLALANSTDGNGEYLFAGAQVQTKPFVPNSSGGFSYLGDETHRFLQVSTERRIADSDSGAAVFQQIRNGTGTYVTQANPANTGNGIILPSGDSSSFVPSLPNGYTIDFTQALPTDPLTYEVRDSAGLVVSGPIPYVDGNAIDVGGTVVTISAVPLDGDSFTVRSSNNQDVFKTVKNIADGLETSLNSSADWAKFLNGANDSLLALDQGINKAGSVRASIGARLNAIDSQSYINEDQILQNKQTLSKIEDVDYAEAISRLNLQMTGLEAAQQSYVKVQGLSLFNYIR